MNEYVGFTGNRSPVSLFPGIGSNGKLVSYHWTNKPVYIERGVFSVAYELTTTRFVATREYGARVWRHNLQAPSNNQSSYHHLLNLVNPQ